MTIPYRPIALSLVMLAFSGLFFARAQAGGGHFYPPAADPLVREECGSCHLAFAPSMLPARSWMAMMGDLKNHFGDDASIDAASAAQISRYLSENAADRGGQRYSGKLMRGVTTQSTPLRITELPKWVSEHRKISASEWQRKDVRTRANCTACHADAPRGYYDE
jgi:hypothetical protein